MSEEQGVKSALITSETDPYDITSVVGDYLANGPGRYRAEYATFAGAISQELGVVAAVVTCAAFSGSSEVVVAVREDAARTIDLVLRRKDLETPANLVRRLAQARADVSGAGARSGDVRCWIALAPDLPLGEPAEIQLAVLDGQVRVDYAAHVYESATARQIAVYLAAVVEAVSESPDRPIAEILRPSWEEALTWLVPPEPDPAPDALLRPGDAVAHWITETPTAVAVDAADGAILTYAELGCAVGALAQRLRLHGDGPVAVLTDDTLTAVVVMVACQLADRCQLVLDPAVAVDRNAALVRGGGGCLIVHDAGTRDAAGLLAARAEVPAWEHRADRVDGSAVPPGRRRPADEGAAYIAFTSGTTGRPKGVVQSRLGFAQFLAWQQQELGLGPGSRVAMWSAPVFDACYMEVFGALAYGATLCLPPVGRRRDPAVVAEWLSSSKVTFFQGVPSFVEHLVAALETYPRALPHLADVIVAGEVLPPALCGRMRAVFATARVRNMFGPTECVLATSHRVVADHPAHRRVPIGRPITGRRIVLVDDEGRPVPRGAVGEIGVASRFLSLGYVGDEAQTAARYRPLPGSTGESIYHTGDFGRIGPDGELRYLGRRDAQVKVRGIRINLDEVEAVLSRSHDVRRCKVVDVRLPAGHVQLVAFVETDPPGPQGVPAAPADARSTATWRRTLAEALGPRVVPARFLVVPRLPQTVTGKPDVRRMRQWDEQIRTSRGRDTPAARGPDAEPIDVIRHAVQEALGHAVADHDDLFSGAADPVLAALRVKKALQRVMPEVFTSVDVRGHRSVGALAGLATASRRGTERSVNG
ncbi:amino acid adenylation domain-containing protein [Kineosporia succinea]|uniref:Amino acid adenylation domain-containing protein n=1 Tax=Kineosporia succinea TaxID=84632 RepID=A0ABT9PCJ9_9ACTN|nr:amino acid adenylation domain-containing protein [Kineosporia succinea]MDP9830207.1 amino acid adenylation domain-containing protein [Kineosporia succinea]